MRKLLLLFIAIFLVSCVAEKETVTRSPGSIPFNIQTSSIPIRWQGGMINGPVSLKISQDFIDGFVAADITNGFNPIEQVMKEWDDAVPTVNFFALPASVVANKGHTNLSQFYDGEMGIYKSYTWFSNVHAEALAIAQYYGIRRNIGLASEYVELIHSDIILNYKNYNFTTDKNDNSLYDLNTVVLHELGHFLGLRHEDDYSKNSIMLPFLSRFDSIRTIENYDQEKIRNNYPSLNNVALMAGPNPLQASGILGTTSKSSPPEEMVRGVIELRANGKCYHYLEDKLTHIH